MMLKDADQTGYAAETFTGVWGMPGRWQMRLVKLCAALVLCPILYFSGSTKVQPVGWAVSFLLAITAIAVHGFLSSQAMSFGGIVPARWNKIGLIGYIIFVVAISQAIQWLPSLSGGDLRAAQGAFLVGLSGGTRLFARQVRVKRHVQGQP